MPKARRRGGRIARSLVGHGMLEEVPDLVEYPVVASGSFSEEFLKLPEEVLTTTMIHHQHFFPIASDQGKLLPVFLAVLNMESEQPEVISRNMERVLTARLRDAQFFYQSDRQQPLAEHQKRLDTVLFHKKIRHLSREVREGRGTGRAHCRRRVQGSPGGRVSRAKPDACARRTSRPTWSASSPSCKARWAESTRAKTAGPKKSGRRSTSITCRSASRRPRRQARKQLGKAAITWAAVSLADKLDTVTGMFAAGERPTGSRDPYGLRRAAQGMVRILVDLPELTGVSRSRDRG